ncbi:MAG: hypothetical protein CMJ14_00735 [Pelagibacterales bacterium]|nr:hypothetical protein [Pelagibacterales bacterium]|tara:strand:- start:62 stop:331 length:270 start_codon:yes stop_codon:yes gene_type:complete
MSKKDFMKEDVINLLGGATSILNTFKDELEERIKDKVEKVIHKLNLVDKNEINLLKEMIEKTRIENVKLNKKISLLENKITKITKSSKK